MVNRQSLRILTFLSLAGALAGFSACGGDESEDAGSTTDTGNQNDTGTVADTSTGNDGGSACAAVDPSHTDALYRVTGVSITNPEGVGAFLQAQMENDINNNILHILVEAKDFDAECGATTFRLTGNAGEYNEAEDAYTWMADAQVPGFVNSTIDDSGFVTNLEPLSLVFPIVEPGSSRIVPLPVTDLAFEGQFDEGETITIFADLSGALLLDDIADVSISITPGADPRALTDVLGMNNMNYPADAETKTGWSLGATLVLEPVTPTATHPDL